MTIIGLGYMGSTPNRSRLGGLRREFLGMQLVGQEPAWPRVPHGRPQAAAGVAEDGGDGVAFFGMGGGGRRHAPTLRGELEQTASRDTRHPRVRRRAPSGDLIAFADPLGNRLEIFHAPRSRPRRSRPGRNISASAPDPLGNGARGAAREGHQRRHPVSIATCSASTLRLHDASLQCYFSTPIRAITRSPSSRPGRNATHHLMVELYNLDDVGKATTWRSARKAASASRSGATSTTRSRRSIRTRRPGHGRVRLGRPRHRAARLAARGGVVGPACGATIAYG